MVQQNTDTQTSHPAEGASYGGQPERYDLQQELEDLRQQHGYAAGEPTGRTLVKENDLRVVLMALRSGARMPLHEASGPTTIHTLQGTIHVHLSDDQIDLEVGHLLAIQPEVAHEIEAATDAAFLLTLGRTRYEHVSQRHQQPEQ